MNFSRLSPVLLLCSALIPGVAIAQNFPSKEITFMIGSAAGSAPDLIARLVKPALEQILKQTIIVENRVGANGLIAVQAVSKANPDGHTLLAAPAGTFTVNPTLYAKTGGGTVVELEGVAPLAAVGLTLAVRPNLGATTCPELIALLRKNPGKYSLASSAQGSFTHLSAEMLKDKAKVDFLIVPFSGAPAGAAAVIGGHSDFIIESTATHSHIAAGRLLALATTSATRNPLAPNLMTFRECGVPNYDLSGWIGIGAPKGTPAAVIQQLNRAIATAVEDPSSVEKLKAILWSPLTATPDQFQRQIVREREEMRQIIQQIKLSIN